MENTKTLDYPYNVADYIMHLMTKGKIPDMDAEKLQICQKYGNWRQSPFSREQLISILEGIVFRSRKENSERHLAILQSRFRDGLSYTAIAKQVGVSSTVVQSSLRHSLNAIIRKLELFFYKSDIWYWN